MPLYFVKPRPMEGMALLIMVDDNRMPLKAGGRHEALVRF